MFDFSPAKFPDLRRKVGEWKELVGPDGIIYVESAAKYICKGDGIHKAVPEHAILGLNEVEVSFNCLKILVIYKMSDGRTKMLEFDIDFDGFGS